MADFSARLPILFRGRKRESQKISRRRQQATAHTQAKRCAFEQGWRRMPRARQPAENSRDKLRGQGILPNERVNVFGEMCM